MDSVQIFKENVKSIDHKNDSIQQLLSRQNKVAATTDSVNTKLNKPINTVESFADTIQTECCRSGATPNR
jgi:hypothetical protein